MLFFFAISNILPLVIPTRISQSSDGVYSVLFLIKKIHDPEDSET